MKPEDDDRTLTLLGSKVTNYPTHPDQAILETFENKHLDSLFLVPFSQERDEMTSLCPVTGQPDVARMEILYVPNIRMVESKSLKLYLFSFRNEGAFHEQIVNRIHSDLWNVLKPKYLRVFGDFAPRGGIAIKPLVEKWESYAFPNSNEQIGRLVTCWDLKRTGR